MVRLVAGAISAAVLEMCGLGARDCSRLLETLETLGTLETRVAQSSLWSLPFCGFGVLLDLRAQWAQLLPQRLRLPAG
eukprot:11884806-Alexandrium_andersonii.AAC.1